MGLKTRKNEAFGALLKNPAVQGDSVVFFKGGSTIIEDRWIQFSDIRVDVGNLIKKWASTKVSKLFSKRNGSLYVLITLDKNHTLGVVPSTSLNQTNMSRVNTFESLNNRLPLILVKLDQDGSTDLSSYKPIVSSAIEVYKGYGNLTLKGPEGLTGPVGDTGLQGVQGETGLQGEFGYNGETGIQGITGLNSIRGITGVEGFQPSQIFRHTLQRIPAPVADFIATPLSGSSPLSTQFTNASEGSWDAVVWDFGDGSVSTSNNPLHIYSSPGTYTVKLLLYGLDDNSEKVRYDYITVS